MWLQGNGLLCGLRNGAVVTVDCREKRERLSSRPITQRISYISSDKKAQSSNKDWFKVFSSFLKLRIKEKLKRDRRFQETIRIYHNKILQRDAKCINIVNTDVKSKVGKTVRKKKSINDKKKVKNENYSEIFND